MAAIRPAGILVHAGGSRTHQTGPDGGLLCRRDPNLYHDRQEGRRLGCAACIVSAGPDRVTCRTCCDRRPRPATVDNHTADAAAAGAAAAALIVAIVAIATC